MRTNLLAIFFAATCLAQRPEFEVATIKPSPDPGMGRIMVGTRGGPGTDDPGRFTCTFCSVRRLLTIAYDVRDFQISGPPTLDSEHFEVVAKIPAGSTRAQFREMMQNLLAERFKLKLHHESKEMPIYQLVVAKGGPKLKESAASSDETPQPPAPGPLHADKDGYPVLPSGRGVAMAINGGHARMQASQATMDQLARDLSNVVGRPVANATGLTAKYDYVLSFAPEPGRGMLGTPPRPPGGDTAPMASASEDLGPGIFTALEEQLGLKLESKKGPVDLLVIEHVEKTPTEN